MPLAGNPCACCTAPICNWTVINEQKNGSAQKCGHEGFVDTSPYKVYKVWAHQEGSSPPAAHGYTRTFTDDYPGEISTCNYTDASLGDYDITACPGCGCVTPDGMLTDSHQGFNCGTMAPCDILCLTDDLSSEDTTADMVGRAESRMTAATWGFTSGGSFFWSERFLETNEQRAAVKSVRFKVVHAPTSTCYLKAWYRTRYCPDDGSTQNETSPPCDAWGAWTEIYTWTGGGNPCLGGCTDLTDQCIDSDWLLTVDPPMTVGTDGFGSTQLEVCISCIPGETPTTACFP